ncbi:MAG TPA: NAD(P)/FAD-dependent oxidoreductase [Iamia sp.]|jgi:cyclohexanone monooxygenase|nr:NAD(P)/FAD-dependent oxidoreductase [Iamia sp.]
MTTTEPSIDREAVLARYRAERDKRLREDGNEQYVEVTGAFAHYVDDPYVPRTERDPLATEVEVALIGGGFSGLVTGARLKQAGIDDVRIIEKGGDVGGTWYWNRYPGAQCDTHSFVYMPLLEETGHMPSEKYAHGPEILAHCQRIATQFGLYDDALLHTEVTSVVWDDDDSRWVIGTDRGDELRARFVVWGTGPLHRPKLPGIPGLGTFEGHTFHTSRWDYDYTGGTHDGAPMDRLADKRVGIIGTGATAVQCVPHLAPACGELFVFQRTPSSIDVRANEPTDPDWFESEVLEPGWQERWMASFTAVQTGNFGHEDLVNDGWTDISRRIRDKILSNPEATFTIESFQQAFEDSDFEKMDEIRSRVDEIVGDGATAAALKPWYRQLCKRPCFHDEYLDAYNEPGTHLIDTDGQGVEKITAHGVVVGGVEYPLDCIIFASGFEVGTEHARRSGFDPVGRDGEALSDHWAEGMRTLHGMHVHGFPNAFILQAAHGANLISNYPHNLSEGGRTIAAIVRHATDHGIAVVEATSEAEDGWMEMLLGEGRVFGAGFLADCTPGYYNNEGRPATPGSGLIAAIGYPEGPVAFFAFIEKWRTDGQFDGLDLRSET